MDSHALPLARHQVTQCRMDRALTLLLGNAVPELEIRIEEPFTLCSGTGEELRVDPEGDPGTMCHALDLLHREAQSGTAFADGRLELTFAGGRRLQVPSSEDYEAWTVVAADGLRLVSMPGGELAVWEPEGSR
jgi:Family of unknown function (DUF6188)